MSQPNYDDVDVLAILGRKTQDGPGVKHLVDDLPPSNFVAFAEEDVEKVDKEEDSE
jgi:hypothetical protein